jgi:2-dehydropantoate 2-reductase
MSQSKGRIVVFGAGSVGCYIGGRLAASGASVRFIGRQAIAAEVAEHGLRVSDWRGFHAELPAEAVDFQTEAVGAAEAALVLVTVKSGATESAGRELAAQLAPDVPVISFQNGLHNAEVLAECLPRQRVLAGMVPFNVVNQGKGHFHHGSEGDLEVAGSELLDPWMAPFEQAGLPLKRHADMPAVLWSKLLLNLNNAVNALSGLPLKAELSQRAYRRCLALCQRETLALLDAAGIRPAKITALPPRWLPAALSVPDWLFRLLGNRMLAIDPVARSSMWEDLERGRRTEVDWINGEVLRLAGRLGRDAPINARMVGLIREAEAGGRRDWSGDALLAELRVVAG